MISKRNYSKNTNMTQPPFGEMINGQALGSVARLRWGLFPMSFNGCEVISVHNALVYLGRPAAICEIARYMEKFRVLLGLFGCNAYRIGKALEHFGVKYDTAKTFEEAENASAFIISSWTGRRLLSSVHTVFCVRECGKIRVYNRFNRCGDVKIYDSPENIFKGRKMIRIYIIEKKKEERQ